MGALDSIVRQGKALYVGISSYSAEKTREAAAILSDLGTPCLIHPPSYSMLNRWIEEDLLDTLGDLGIGCIAFSPLAQGMLSSKYLDGVPDGSRASKGTSLWVCSPILAPLERVVLTNFGSTFGGLCVVASCGERWVRGKEVSCGVVRADTSSAA